jgi:hypothetical protein
VQSEQGECFFKLDCRYLGYDGKVFGEVETSLGIAEFRGAKKINTLDVFPLQYHEQEEKLKDTLVSRGREFISLIGMHHRYYKGFAFVNQNEKPNRVYVEGRLMIDAREFTRANPNYSSLRISSHGYRLEESCRDHMRTLAYRTPNDLNIVKTNAMALNEIKEEDLLLCSATVLGFSLSNSLWVSVLKTLSLLRCFP